MNLHEQCEILCEQRVSDLNLKFANRFADTAKLLEDISKLIYNLTESHIALSKRVEFLETLIAGSKL